jgi:hypothetical protein
VENNGLRLKVTERSELVNIKGFKGLEFSRPFGTGRGCVHTSEYRKTRRLVIAAVTLAIFFGLELADRYFFPS